MGIDQKTRIPNVKDPKIPSQLDVCWAFAFPHTSVSCDGYYCKMSSTKSNTWFTDFYHMLHS